MEAVFNIHSRLILLKTSSSSCLGGIFWNGIISHGDSYNTSATTSGSPEAFKAKLCAALSGWFNY